MRVGASADRSRWTRVYSRRLLVTDFLVLVWTYVGMHLVWAIARPDDPRSNDPIWYGVSLFLGVVWLLALAVADTRDRRIVGSGPEEYKRIATSTVLVFGLVSLVIYAIGFLPPRPYVVVALPLGLSLLIASRWTWRQWLHVKRSRGRMSDDVLVVGSARSVSHLIETLHTTWHAGYRPIAACVEDGAEGQWINGVPVIGDLTDVAKHAESAGVAGVVVGSSNRSHADMMRQLGWDLQDLDIDLVVAPALTNIAGPRLHVRPVAGVPLLHVEPPRYQGGQYWTKAALDRLGSLTGLIVLSPLLVVVALLVALTSRGPIFYVQRRVGLEGRTFGMLKFRSMVVGADERVHELSGDAGNEMLFKMRNDPRVTPVGRLLRRLSIDELPQLFNVLIGDMSLVGPRPPLPNEVEAYEGHVARRLLVRPGITGLWQVSGRSDLSWEESVRLDLYYVENWSFVGDLVLLGKTLRAVLSSKGAY